MINGRQEVLKLVGIMHAHNSHIYIHATITCDEHYLIMAAASPQLCRTPYRQNRQHKPSVIYNVVSQSTLYILTCTII